MHPGKYSLLGMGSMFPTVPNEEKLCRVSLPRSSAITEAAAYLFGQSLTSTGRNISKQWGHCLERWCVFTAVFPVPAFPPGLCWQVTGTPDSRECSRELCWDLSVWVTFSCLAQRYNTPKKPRRLRGSQHTRSCAQGTRCPPTPFLWSHSFGWGPYRARWGNSRIRAQNLTQSPQHRQ